jgi:hypothetical protein
MVGDDLPSHPYALFDLSTESTNSRVLWLSLLSLTFLIGSTVWQIFYLKRYFQKKKII